MSYETGDRSADSRSPADVYRALGTAARVLAVAIIVAGGFLAGDVLPVDYTTLLAAGAVVYAAGNHAASRADSTRD